MSHPFEKMAKTFAVRMRSKVHSQSYSNTIMSRKARNISPTGRLAIERVSELTELQKRHQRTFDPSIRTQATQILRTLPLLSTDEDPKFIQTHRALRAAIYFDAIDLPVTYALINQYTKNAFLLDAVAISTFFLTLSKIQHPQMKDIIAILQPRLRELAPELIPREAIHILRVLHRTGVEDVKLINILTETVINTVSDTSLEDVRQCVIILAETYPDEAKRVLIAANKRLCEDIEICEDINQVKSTIMDICRTISLICYGPRELLNSIARRSLDLSPHLTPLDIAYILKAFHLSSYRHLRLLRILSSSLAGRITTGNSSKELSPIAVSMTIQALSHFYVTGCEEIVLTLLNAVVDRIEGLHLALILISCVRLQCISPTFNSSIDLLCASPLRRYTQNAHSLQVTSRLLYALSQAGKCTSTEDIVNLQALLNAILRIRGSIPGDSKNFIFDAVTTLSSDNRCIDSGVKGLLERVREKISYSYNN